MPCLEHAENVKARHLFFTREISSPRGNMMQMRICSEDILPKLAALPLFKGCAVQELKGVLKDVRGSVRLFAAGEVVLHEGETASSMAVVVSGVVLVRECGLEDDARHLVQRLYAGGTFGATFPALAPKNFPGMLVAEEQSEVLFLEVVPIRRLMEKGAHPRFLASLYAAACVQGFYAWRKLMLLSCYEIGDRVLLYLRWRREDGFTAPARFRYGELAEYLGVNRTALYRALAKLRKAGRIRVEDGTLALA